jgi:hypothetical protein
MGSLLGSKGLWIAKWPLWSCVEECKNMLLLSAVAMLILVGEALYLINRYIPMASNIKAVLNGLVVVVVGVWLFQAIRL